MPNGHQPTNKQVAEWKQRRAKGETYWRIGAEYDYTEQTVSKYVNDRYVLPTGTPYRCPEPEWWSKARELYAQGISIINIGIRFNKDESTVRNAVCPKFRERNCERKRNAKSS